MLLGSGKSYYELLEVSEYAEKEEIIEKYNKKLSSIATLNVDLEPYHTAYYILTDKERRAKYDQSIGIHSKRKSPVYRAVLNIARLVLSILDSLSVYSWCLVIAMLISGAAYYIYNNVLGYTEIIIDSTVISIYIYSLIALALISVILWLFHPAIRRYNRKLKEKVQ